ncbi:hypothetical protein TSUD_116550 [Trifolium subterraneum]|uniref:Cellulose synthase n=1 Tax=Trifolium subterraneum TaxID=3900 RepID=A0A2Z6N178_TRISU|nr:hypothetical protein TSUD_116550 [Trifolium subterraneum]
METNLGLVVSSHNRNEFIIIRQDGDFGRRELQELNGDSHTCQLCGEDIGINADGDPFVACNECAFPVCRNCYEYERREGNQVCPQCKTRFKRLKGCARVEGDEEEDDIDDLEYEFDFDGQNEQYVQFPMSPEDEELSEQHHAIAPLNSTITKEITLLQARPMDPSKDLAAYGYGSVAWKERMEIWKQRQSKLGIMRKEKNDNNDDLDKVMDDDNELPLMDESRQPLSRKLPIPSSQINPYHKVHSSFVKERRAMKREYEEFRVRINSLVAKAKKVPEEGWTMQDGTPWPGNNICDHPGMIQVFLGENGGCDMDGNVLPRLVYVSREKRPSFNHQRKAGALNALINMKGLDGIQGPTYVGTGCVFRRQAFYGFDAPKKKKSPNKTCNCWLKCCCFGLCCMGKRKKNKKLKKSKLELMDISHRKIHSESSIAGSTIGINEDVLAPISSQKFVKKFGQSPIFIASTQLVDGETVKHGGLKMLERISYINAIVYPWTSIPLVAYCTLPAVCLLTGKFIIPEV